MKINPTTYGGVEGEYSWTDQEFTASSTFVGGLSAKIKEKYNYGLSGRLGWLSNPTTMLYARAGWQWTRLEYSAGFGGLSGSQNKDHDGFRLGAGAEVAVTPDWLLRLDYAHTWYSEETFTSGTDTEKFEPRHNVFRVGIARQF